MAKKKTKYTRRRHNSPGSSPGVLSVDPDAVAPRLSLVRYDSRSIEFEDAPDPATLKRPQAGTMWLNVEGLGDVALLEQIARVFGLHPLAMEDVGHSAQRPKVEDYDQHTFIVLRVPIAGETFASEQVAMFLGRGFVITFMERATDIFAPVLHRMRVDQSPIRMRKADYLAYALIDTMVDSYFPVLEGYGERLELLEDEVLFHPDPKQIKTIHANKQQLMAIRNSVRPMRDLLGMLLREDSTRISDATRIYLRDCHDHTFQLFDMIETYREIASGLVDIHLSSQNNTTNDVVRVLTLISTIFIPLTFIVGVYGMNFEVMPELSLRWGYPGVMIGMGLIAVALVIWFKRKGWLDDGR
ncbi:magnesium/cobalt transporter CorA [Pararhodobacter sp.]|uniref:magnesium/cobalt transporter CorA n=1 Tax=Pararhodobacter sp. TaxID=2127056 RepID=UPI002AFE971B|nr:magnesium/cobalt transporter CorA [Pararhodobacter sp.]